MLLLGLNWEQRKQLFWDSEVLTFSRGKSKGRKASLGLNDLNFITDGRPRRAWKCRESNLIQARRKDEVCGDLLCCSGTQLFYARVNIYVGALLCFVCLFVLLQTVSVLQAAIEGGFNRTCCQRDPSHPILLLSSLWYFYLPSHSTPPPPPGVNGSKFSEPALIPSEKSLS